jgi:hypothetical protein
MAMLTRGMAEPGEDGGGDEVATEVLPPFVTTDADRERWANAEMVARNVLGSDATDEAVWQMRRTIFHDRTTYPD